MKSRLPYAAFEEKFDAHADFAHETYEVDYEMLWQGEPEDE